MSILIESMTRIEHQELTIRVWREEIQLITEAVIEQNFKDVKGLLSQLGNWNDVHSMALAIMDLSRVNAVEVVRTDKGFGIVLYKDWP